MKMLYEKININLQALTGIAALIGAVVYRLIGFKWTGLIITAVLIVAVFGFFQWAQSRGRFLNIDSPLGPGLPNRDLDKQRRRNDLYLMLFYLTTVFFCFRVLIINATSLSIISPWEAVPKYFFLFYFLATLILALYIYKNGRWPLFFLSLHYFLSFSILIFIFQIGYGFDPFVHRATLSLIAENGAVDPKPFYYLGQYSLEILANKYFHIPLIWIDKLLVPALAALFLPTAFYYSLKKWFGDSYKLFLVILCVLCLPFGIFILTTPQNLAYLFLILAILYGMKCDNCFELSLVYIFAFASLSIHPLAGIPAVLYAFSVHLFCSDLKNKSKYYLAALLFFLLIVSLPAAFYFLNRSMSAAETDATSLDSLNLITSNLKIYWPGEAGLILNYVYLLSLNNFYFIILMAVVGIAVAWKYRNECRFLFLFILISLGLFASYLLTAFLPFPYLISYERADYLERILLMTMFFLLPFILIAIYALIDRISTQDNFIKASWLGLILALITASLYLSYPRLDAYFNSHSYSVGQSDIEAVRWINDNSDKDYIVLANQQVSAAALSQFGFSKYYKNDIFYYPIPTGGPLYQYYLDMVYKKPSRETMVKAMDSAGVNEGYLVLNKYWWAFPKIAAEAKLTANSWAQFNQGEVFVMKYKK